MLNKTEMNLIEKIRKASVECKLEAMKVCREELVLFYNTLGAELSLSETKIVVEETKEEKTVTKEENKTEKVETKKETTKESKKKYNTTKMTKCGHDEGKNEIISLGGDVKQFHGQIRWNNEVKNFIYTPQIYFPVIFGATDEQELEFAREEIIKQIRKKYDKLPTCFNREIVTSQGADIRFYRDFDRKEQLYVTPKFDNAGKDTDIVATGYINDHAFTLRRDGEVRFKHYNYFFRKCGFEKTASKGYDTESMGDRISFMLNVVVNRMNKALEALEAKNAKAEKEKDFKIDPSFGFGKHFDFETPAEGVVVPQRNSNDDEEQPVLRWSNAEVEF